MYLRYNYAAVVTGLAHFVNRHTNGIVSISVTSHEVGKESRSTVPVIFIVIYSFVLIFGNANTPL